MKKKEKTKLGAPSKLTDENIVNLREVAMVDGTVEEMAFLCNVTKQTIYNWFKERPDLFDEIERLRANPVLKARRAIVNALDDPNHAFRYVERKRKDEFSTKTETDSTVKFEMIFDPVFNNAPTPETEGNSTESSEV